MCTPSGDPSLWPLYQNIPIEVATRSFVSAFAITQLGVQGEMFTFQVPVRLLVDSSPPESSRIALGSTVRMTCSDERTRSFRYTIVDPSYMADTQSGWEPAALSQIACEADGKSALLSW